MVTTREKYRFDIVCGLCKRAGMTARETAFFLHSGKTIPPFKDEIDAWRQRESFGKDISITNGIENLLRGKADIESSGDFCSNSDRTQNTSMTSGWEGTAYWDQFPGWYTKIVLWWHPKYNPRVS